jgi:tetratricopeptide (TPR) repeat protein
MDPDEASAAIASGLAEAYLALGDPYAAAAEAERGVVAKPADARLWALLGLARHRLADVSGARLAMGRAIGLDEREADAHWGLGLLAIAQNRPREAVERVEHALALRRDPRYALSLARWAAVGGDYARAASALGRFLELGRDDPRAEGYRNLRRFYDLLAEGPVAAVDRRTTRVQLNFDLKAGDEIPYVPVRFGDGPPVYVLFDTGAERNVLDRAFAESIGLTPILPGGRLHGVYRQSPGGYAVVDRLAVGSIVVTRVPFAVGDFGSLALRAQGDHYIAGVINPSLLFRDFLVVLDYRHRRIELVRYGAGAEEWLARPTSFRRTAVPFVFDVNGIWPVVRARLDGSRELPFLVDTGASDLLIDRPTGGVLQLDLDRFSVALGEQRRDGLSGILLDGVLSELWGITVHGILGYPFFREARVAFDYRNMVMIVEN